MAKEEEVNKKESITLRNHPEGPQSRKRRNSPAKEDVRRSRSRKAVQQSTGVSTNNNSAEIPSPPETTQCYLDLRCSSYDEIAVEVRKYRNRVGEYTIEEVLGKGSFGNVFSARTTFNDEKVAIKKGGPLKNQRRIAMVKREATLLSDHGHHPNIVTLLNAMHSRKRFYTVMPQAKVDLNTLCGIESNVRLKQPDFLQKAMQGVLSGLRHLHGHGVAHLDIKAENILVFTSALDINYNLRPGRRMESSCFQITDLGVSKVSSEYGTYHAPCANGLAPEHSVHVDERVGTSLWYAPEITLEDCGDGRVADMWSFGCLLRSLSGFPPIEFREACILMKQKDLGGYWQRLEQLEGFMAIVQSRLCDSPNKLVLMHDLARRCLRMDPFERATALEALQHPWFQYKYPKKWGSKID